MFSFGKPSQAKFASQLIALLKVYEPHTQFRFDNEESQIIRVGEKGHINLTNMYHEHCSLPRKDREANLLKLVSIFKANSDELPEHFEDAKPHLRPKIYARSTLEFLNLEQRLKGDSTRLDVPLYPLGSHLYASLAFDTEHSIRSISNDDLQRWGVTYYEAQEIACQNLDEASMIYSKIGEGFHASMSMDNYDSARILLFDRILSMSVVGDHLGIVPQRDAMYVAGSKDEMSLTIMFELTEKAVTEELRPLSPLPLKLEDGEWIDWEPPKNHVLRGQFESLKLNFLGGLYGQQKQLLDALIDAGEELPFVATFSATEKDDQQLSLCVWSQNVDSLLPRTQRIAFVSDAGILAAGNWEHVASIVGDLMLPDESYYPLRYRVRNFPSADQIAEIGICEPFNQKP